MAPWLSLAARGIDFRRVEEDATGAGGMRMSGAERQFEQERREALRTRAGPNIMTAEAAEVPVGFDLAAIRPGVGHPQPIRYVVDLARFGASGLVVSLAFHAAAFIAMLLWPHSPPVTAPPEAIPVEIVIEEPPPLKPEAAVAAETPPVAEAASPPPSPPPPPPVDEPLPSPVEPTPIPEAAARPEPALVPEAAARPEPPPPALAAPSLVPEATAQRELAAPLVANPQRPPVAAPPPVRSVQPAPQPATPRAEPRNVPAHAPHAGPSQPKPPRPEPLAPKATSPGVSGADIAEYQRAVIARISAVKRYPDAARGRAPQGVAVVSFSINASGQVAGVSISRSAGDAILDAEALATVRRASPFPPPPAGAPRMFSAPLSFRVR